MMNSAQLPAHDPDRGVMRLVYRSFLFAVTLLACLSETIAIVLFFERRQLGLDSTLAWILPLLVLLPGLAGVRTYRQIKASFAAARMETIPPAIWRALAAAVGSAYVALIFVLVLLVSCLRAGGRL